MILQQMIKNTFQIIPKIFFVSLSVHVLFIVFEGSSFVSLVNCNIKNKKTVLL